MGSAPLLPRFDGIDQGVRSRDQRFAIFVDAVAVTLKNFDGNLTLGWCEALCREWTLQ